MPIHNITGRVAWCTLGPIHMSDTRHAMRHRDNASMQKGHIWIMTPSADWQDDGNFLNETSIRSDERTYRPSRDRAMRATDTGVTLTEDVVRNDIFACRTCILSGAFFSFVLHHSRDQRSNDKVMTGNDKDRFISFLLFKPLRELCSLPCV